MSRLNTRIMIAILDIGTYSRPELRAQINPRLEIYGAATMRFAWPTTRQIPRRSTLELTYIRASTKQAAAAMKKCSLH
jgi:hypothetical protein